ncbi:MAG: hypothetical protein AAFP19_19290, partial [Bacteroidota bacterium]
MKKHFGLFLKRAGFWLLAMLMLHHWSFAQSGPLAEEADNYPVSTEQTTTKEQTASARNITVNMVALDQPIILNRLGAAIPAGMIYALKRDVVAKDPALGMRPGNVRLRDGKRPRPIALRANKGDVITINFTNYLTPNDTITFDSIDIYAGQPVKQEDIINGGSGFFPKTRYAGVHAMGVEVVNSLDDDGSWVGDNNNSLVAPGGSITYTVRAVQEGIFLLYSTAAPVGGLAAGQLENGLFGTLSVQPENAVWYRSQVTEAELAMATNYYVDSLGNRSTRTNGLPIINYDAVYPKGHPSEGVPILRMLDSNHELVHSDLTAIIAQEGTGPNGGPGPFTNVSNDPIFAPSPAYPNREQPYREFVINYHEPLAAQSFSVFYDSNMKNTVTSGSDQFAINYATGGIGAEIYANRIGVGPMHDCEDCAYEEFFLSAWAVGDPGMVVDIPANSTAATIDSVNPSLNNLLLQGIGSGEDQTPAPGPKANYTLYPDDPSNVYHSYMNDHVKFRVSHAGANITHVHHQHAHQWLHSPNSDDGHYLDSQSINPGTSYTMDIAYNGSGNRNKTVGDQIFHCHFYPHFAEGMWAMWRVHDVFEKGTKMDGNMVADNTRALPDGEIATGTPIPGLVPLPTMPMAPTPDPSVYIKDGQIAFKNTPTRNVGYPFFIPGIAGQRAPHPPLDFAIGERFDTLGNSIGVGELNGGLPRHVIAAAKVPFHRETKYDWTKIMDRIRAIQLPEEGTLTERLAMDAHARRLHTSVTPEGTTSSGGTTNPNSYFILNGRPPAQGAPYADPAVGDSGEAVGTKRTYKAANIQLDVVLNKKGWHYPQQRIITLWEDVAPTILGERPPEPFFFRANSDEYVEYWHTNLVPEYYEADDFQVRTPTDIIGQHIHLVKFDVTASDGAANGWNYEDGTFSPQVVQERIHAINNGGKLWTYSFNANRPISDTTQYALNRNKLELQGPHPIWGKPASYQPNFDWNGAQTTIQRWYADPLRNNQGFDRTVRTVFTHDHFGPSTHQQAGLYAGLLVEPAQSKWYDPVTGVEMGTRSDGGPTSWQANIHVTTDIDSSYREFALEFQDIQLAYWPNSPDSIRKPYPIFPEYPYTQAEYDTFVYYADNVYRGWRSDDAANNPFSIGAPAGGSQLITGNNAATYSLNYRNEPLPLRTANPATYSSSKGFYGTPGIQGDMAHAFASIERADPDFNRQPVNTSIGKIGPYGSNGTVESGPASNFKFPQVPLTPGMNDEDPFTPMLRAYEGDRIQIRTLVGAHLTSHTFNIHGNKFFFEPSNTSSGYVSTQLMSLSEHFEMNFVMPTTTSRTDSAFADYLYVPSADLAGQQNGLWGLMRAYDSNKPLSTLQPLPNNRISTSNDPKQDCGCPDNAIRDTFTVVALTAAQALAD